MSISFQDFNSIYEKSMESVLNFWTAEMQKEIAAHCHGWGPESFDFECYLRASAIRFYKAYDLIGQSENINKICDIGSFWGVFPLTLQELGYDVTMTESFKYYSDSFDNLFNFIRNKGVQVVDFDPFQAEESLSSQFDFITIMAVLEHYPHSHKIFLDNAISLMKPNSKIYIEVPNIAYWPKRMSFLKGHTPLVPIQDIYKSKIPFIGHHHEFTMSELIQLATLSKLTVISKDFYNYSEFLNKERLGRRNIIKRIAFKYLKDSRECISVLCERNKNTH